MSLDTWKLSDSAFLANLGAGERSFWRFLAALFGGIFAFVLVTILAALASFAGYVFIFGWPAPTSLETLQAFARRLSALAASDGRSFTDALEILILALPSNVLPMFAFIGVAALAHWRSLRGLATAAPRFRWRMLLVGLVLSVLVIGPFLAVGQLLDPKAEAPPVLTVGGGVERTTYVILCVLGFIPAALGEEILFRGWLLRQTSNITRNPAVLLIINGVVFAAAHGEFAPDAFLQRAIMGAGFGYMTLRLSGVEISSGAHAANNLMIVLFLEPLTLKQPSGAGIDASTLFSSIGLFVAYVGMAELMARWTPLRQWAGAPAVPPSIVEAEHFS